MKYPTPCDKIDLAKATPTESTLQMLKYRYPNKAYIASCCHARTGHHADLYQQVSTCINYKLPETLDIILLFACYKRYSVKTPTVNSHCDANENRLSNHKLHCQRLMRWIRVKQVTASSRFRESSMLLKSQPFAMHQLTDPRIISLSTAVFC